ncbi:MAG: hypothetical protein WAP07_02465 [Acutalibacteraceae bacterium]
MNNIKKLIQMLKEYQKSYIGHDYIFYEIKFCNPRVQMCIEALEKQIPKKIIYDYGLNETRCPRCNTIFGYAYEEDETEDMYYAPYCYECGQYLDWEVENEWY